MSIPTSFSEIKIGMCVEVSFHADRESSGPRHLESFLNADKIYRARGVVLRKASKRRKLSQKEVLKLNKVEESDPYLILGDLDLPANWTIVAREVIELQIIPMGLEELLTCTNEEIREMAMGIQRFKE